MNKVTKKMASFLPAIRISFGLVMLSVSILLVADVLGFVPDLSKSELKARKKISESLAIQFSILATDRDLKTIRKLLTSIVNRDEDILSAGFRNSAGTLIFQIGNHNKLWGTYNSSRSTTSQVTVPIFRGKSPWGSIELKFKSLPSESYLGILSSKFYQLVLFVFIFGFFGFLFFILRTLRQLDPSAVIPDRVNAAFDTLAEGVLILDEKEQIVLANSAFAETVDRTPSSLLGVIASELGWKFPTETKIKQALPWKTTLQSGKNSMGEKLLLAIPSGGMRKFIVNSAPIINNQGKKQGALITFDDVTELDERNDQLQDMVTQLEITQSEVQQQNKELHYLATRDPMTNCLNRRSFNEQFEVAFKSAKDNNEELSCIMADIDHFKLVNDNYGHGVGDEIIILLADILHANTRKIDIVGRYGGEEFCIVLPGIPIDEAVSVAERIRLRVKDDSINSYPDGPNITASLGVSSIFDHAVDPAELNNQADSALYVAKESGRNKVISWTPEQAIPEDSQPTPASEQVPDESLSDNEQKEVTPSSDGEVQRLKVQIKHLQEMASKFSEELQHKQNYDSLTGLPNQTLFFDRIAQAINRGHRYNYLAAVLTVDIDLFSQLNNTLGRTGGDLLLKRLADRINGILRDTDGVALFSSESDDPLVSRLGADEFGILLTDLSSRETATWIIKRLFDTLLQPVDIEDKKVFIQCNVGISLYPDDADSPEDLLQHSMTAKQHAKQMHDQNNFQFYDVKMQELSIKQMHLETDLRRAIKNEEWVLYYQPQMNIETGKIKGVEALIRWNHPEKGIVTPFEFIEFAEQRGFIIPIGEWVLKQACIQGKEWIDNGITDLMVAVNLSAVQLQLTNFANTVLKILDETKFPPRNLELEVTETMLLDKAGTAINTLKRLHSRGIKISIDDFGTGYSSLNYLKHLPIDTLKIDRGFIIDILTDDFDKNIVNTIITMAHGMNLKVIAEGVETQPQLDLLSDMSCDEIQGYLLSKPKPAEEIMPLLKKSEISFTLTEN